MKDVHSQLILGMTPFHLLVFRWLVVGCLFGLLLGFGLFYAARRRIEAMERAWQSTNAAARRTFYNPEFREELKVTLEYGFLLLVVPLLAAGSCCVSLVQNGLHRLGVRRAASVASRTSGPHFP